MAQTRTQERSALRSLFPSFSCLNFSHHCFSPAESHQQEHLRLFLESNLRVLYGARGWNHRAVEQARRWRAAGQESWVNPVNGKIIYIMAHKLLYSFFFFFFFFSEKCALTVQYKYLFPMLSWIVLFHCMLLTQKYHLILNQTQRNYVLQGQGRGGSPWHWSFISPFTPLVFPPHANFPFASYSTNGHLSRGLRIPCWFLIKSF